jgi:hypothetical protein
MRDDACEVHIPREARRFHRDDYRPLPFRVLELLKHLGQLRRIRVGGNGAVSAHAR